MTNDDISCFLYFSVIPSKKSRCFWLSNSGGLMQAAAKGNMQKVMEYGVMSMPALVVNEKVVSMGKVLKVADVEKRLHKLGF